MFPHNQAVQIRQFKSGIQIKQFIGIRSFVVWNQFKSSSQIVSKQFSRIKAVMLDQSSQVGSSSRAVIPIEK
jgi:hypothetical protein